MSAELPMAGERAERCETCRWWDDITVVDNPLDGEDVGQAFCHRYPPVRDIDPQYIRSHQHPEGSMTARAWLHPLTFSFDFCGEWQPQAATTGGGGG